MQWPKTRPIDSRIGGAGSRHFVTRRPIAQSVEDLSLTEESLPWLVDGMNQSDEFTWSLAALSNVWPSRSLDRRGT